MAQTTKQINQILGGLCPMENYCAPSEYLAGIGIDPDMPKTDSDRKPSGLIRPTSTEVLSTLTLAKTPLWILTNPKNTSVYVYLKSGEIYATNASYSTPALVYTKTASKGNGCAYYDNACYFAGNTGIAKMLFKADGTVNSFTDDYWAGDVQTFLSKTAWATATAYVSGNEISINNYNYLCLKAHTSGVFATDLASGYWTVSGLAWSALSNNTYPSINGVEIPNHPLFTHRGSRALYIGDVISDSYGSTLNRGKGCIHKIKPERGT